VRLHVCGHGDLWLPLRIEKWSRKEEREKKKRYSTVKDEME
jgi:hypothetical protein